MYIDTIFDFGVRYPRGYVMYSTRMLLVSLCLCCRRSRINGVRVPFNSRLGTSHLKPYNVLSEPSIPPSDLDLVNNFVPNAGSSYLLSVIFRVAIPWRWPWALATKCLVNLVAVVLCVYFCVFSICYIVSRTPSHTGDLSPLYWLRFTLLASTRLRGEFWIRLALITVLPKALFAGPRITHDALRCDLDNG